MRLRPTRRDLLKLGAAAAATAFVTDRDPVQARAAWKALPIGTQLWCVRKQLATDIPGTLAALRAAGFAGVELENAFRRSGREWRTHLEAAGLKACGFHHTLAELQGDALKATIEFNQEIGNPFLIIRSLPEATYTSADLLAKTADAVNAAAATVKPYNMRVGYHNHFADFNRIDGEFWWNRFADRTGKDVVLQLDTGNASELHDVGLVDLIRRNPGRTATMHVKPFSKKTPTAYIGADELDWAGIMTAAESVGGTEWYIIEYEREGAPPVDALKANLENFVRMRR